MDVVTRRERWLQAWIGLATACLLLSAAVTFTGNGNHKSSLLAAVLLVLGSGVSGVGITMLL